MPRMLIPPSCQHPVCCLTSPLMRTKQKILTMLRQRHGPELRASVSQNTHNFEADGGPALRRGLTPLLYSAGA